ncbi:MAG: histidinol-phosphate transaminase [Candidatus Eiseniibacteriota bacterium]
MKSAHLDIEALARPDIRDLLPYQPGKPVAELERELGISGAVKLASNENPLGPSPRALEAMRAAAAEVNRYPEGGCFYLRRRLAEMLDVGPEQLVIGSGSNDLIELLCHVFVAPGDEIVTSQVTFPMYAIGARISGGRLIATPARDLHYDLEAMAAAVTERTKIVFIANPNNPTGLIVTADQVERFMAAIPESVLVAFDEAYIEYVDDPDFPRTLDYLRAGRHVCILRTFSKAYSLAGMRVGYGIMPAATVGLLNRVRMPFNVTSVAQAGALAALDDQAHVQRCVQVNRDGMEMLIPALERLGCEVTPSWANFLLVRFPGIEDLGELLKGLEQRGVIVRGMVPFGLTEHVRLSVGLRSENERLLAALEELLA